jgi:hypothetical protein
MLGLLWMCMWHPANRNVRGSAAYLETLHTLPWVSGRSSALPLADCSQPAWCAKAPCHLVHVSMVKQITLRDPRHTRSDVASEQWPHKVYVLANVERKSVVLMQIGQVTTPAFENQHTQLQSI